MLIDFKDFHSNGTVTIINCAYCLIYVMFCIIFPELLENFIKLVNYLSLFKLLSKVLNKNIFDISKKALHWLPFLNLIKSYLAKFGFLWSPNSFLWKKLKIRMGNFRDLSRESLKWILNLQNRCECLLFSWGHV